LKRPKEAGLPMRRFNLKFKSTRAFRNGNVLDARRGEG
jgi:hypothetical protein